MKRSFFLTLGLVLAIGGATGSAQTAALYQNDGVVQCPPDIPPQIDAVTFINNNVFNISYTNTYANAQRFKTANTLYYTNTVNGRITVNPGIEFNTGPTGFGFRQMAQSFHNEGVITAESLSNIITVVNPSLLFPFGVPQIIIDAANVVNTGTLNVGYDGLCKIHGQDLDLSRGAINLTSAGINLFNGFSFNSGYFDGYWGVGSDRLNPFVQFENTRPPRSPFEIVTDRNGNFQIQNLVLPNALIYLEDTTLGSNRTVKAVFLNNTNFSVTPNVYFTTFPGITVELAAKTTNAFGIAETNFTYLLDYFGVETNLLLFINGYAGVSVDRPTYAPWNYVILQNGLNPLSPLFLGNPASPGGIPANTFDIQTVSNDWSAYQAIFPSTSLILADVAHQDVTNLPGRIELSADRNLNLEQARISSLNYLALNATNQFVSSRRAQVSSPYADLNLRTTNGLLSITNVLAPFVVKPEGTLSCYSARWTNIVGGITNEFHVLMVDVQMAPITPSRVQTLLLRTTNNIGAADSIVISDVLNVTRTFNLDCTVLTITTNEPGAPTASGAINLTAPNIIWSDATPRLQYLTNNGYLNAANAVYFGGSRTSPYYGTNFNEPYQAFVNNGNVTNNGSLIWAKHFESYGTFVSPAGGFDLQQMQVGQMTNGLVFVPRGSISVAGSSLFASNQTFVAGGAITLLASNLLSDGIPNLATLDPTNLLTATVTNGNQWFAGAGVNMLAKPQAMGDLLGTIVTNVAAPHQNVTITWAGEDRGSVNEGFLNNGALGGLVLEATDTDSLFTFASPGGAKALYVDFIELRGAAATNFDQAGNFLSLAVAPGMKVYFAQATANGASIAEKLNGKSDGRFVWASYYNYGYYSSTFKFYDGVTNRINAALAESCDIDSDGDGIVNCMDLSPIRILPWTPSTPNVPSDFFAMAATFIPKDVVITNNPGGGGSTNVVPSNGLPKLAMVPAGQFGQSGKFSDAQGTYTGLVSDTNGVATASSGFLTLKVSSSGTYSGKLLVGGKSYTLSGRFSDSGLASNAVRFGTTALNVRMEIDRSGKDQLRGSVDGGSWTAELLADRAVPMKSRAVKPDSGAYTMVIPPGQAGPGGYGFGTVNVSGSGSVTWAGTLSDGTKVTQGSAISKEGYWPLYAPLYAGGGTIISWVRFQSSANSDLNGEPLIWIKRSGLGTQYAPAGFTNGVRAVGSKVSASKRPLDILQGKLIFSGGGLSQPLTNYFTLDSRNRAISDRSSRLTLSFTGATGLFKGSVANPATGRTISFQGALFDKGSIGIGYFYGVNNHTGPVWLQPEQ
jgi:hypothetical protein